MNSRDSMDNQEDDSTTDLLKQEITSISEQLDGIQSAVTDMWYEVIVPYISSPHTAQVLTKLKNTATDRQMFCDFMISQNSSYLEMKEYLEVLEETLYNKTRFE